MSRVEIKYCIVLLYRRNGIGCNRFLLTSNAVLRPAKKAFNIF